jgi:archaellum component FlaC
MTIDERLEALAERRQALTETVELLTHDIAELRAIVAQDAENIRELARIVRSHERRTSDLGEGEEE